jgi:hypothetical protein
LLLLLRLLLVCQGAAVVLLRLLVWCAACAILNQAAIGLLLLFDHCDNNQNRQDTVYHQLTLAGVALAFQVAAAKRTEHRSSSSIFRLVFFAYSRHN